MAALMPAISTRVAALTVTLAQSNAPNEKSSRAGDTTPSKQAQPAPADQYVGSDSCAECHAAQVQQNVLTAHGKINQSNVPVDSRSCEACHGGAKGHVDYYLTIQKLNEAGKEDEANVLMNDTVRLTPHKCAPLN
jgi:hypothetical protein